MFDLRKMRQLFVVLEQQRVSRDAVENLGRPSEEKLQNLLEQKASRVKKTFTGMPPKKTNPKGGGNANLK